MNLFRIFPILAVAMGLFSLQAVIAKEFFDDQRASVEESNPVFSQEAPGEETLREGSLLYWLSQEEDFSVFYRLVLGTELRQALESDEPHTVFAPSNAAFEILSEGMIQQLKRPANRRFLVHLLSGHLVPGLKGSADFEEETEVTAVSGTVRTVIFDDLGFYVDQIEVAEKDVATDNGLLHRIEVILAPQGNP